MQTVPGVAEAVLTDTRIPLPAYKARVSFLDGSGTQLIMLSWQRSDGLLKGVNVLFQDQWGIKDCYGLDEMEVQRWEELVHDLETQGFISFQTPFAYALSLVMEARVLNRRTRRKLPIAYAIWRPFIEAELSVEDRSNTIPTVLDPLLLDDETIALAQHGAELYNFPEFMSWLYQATEGIEPFITRYWSAQTIFDTLPEKRTRGRKGKAKPRNLQDHASQARLDELINEAIDALIDDKWRLLYEGRLRRQAAFFLSADRKQEVQLIRAIAAVLHPDSSVPVREQAFPRAMLRASIEQGPLRMMVEAIGTSNFGSLPINLFDQDF
jgi:hypothetical protein